MANRRPGFSDCSQQLQYFPFFLTLFYTMWMTDTFWAACAVEESQELGGPTALLIN